MLFKPLPLGYAKLDPQTLEQDKKGCRKYGPCGVGEKALYLNSFYIDRRYYLPYASIRRAYKRIAMSKGGFTGKGLFATMPYLVVEYDDGREKQCNFKFEQNVDALLADLAQRQPQIKQLSAKAEQKRAEQAAAEAAKPRPVLTEEARQLAGRLENARIYLENQPGFAQRMSSAAKAKRMGDRTNPHYKWVALAVVLAGLVALVWGILSFIKGEQTGMYLMLIGLAAIFFFSSAQVLPTAKNNKKALARQLEEVQAQAACLVEEYGSPFPVPARYAHPLVLARMKRVVEEGRAQTAAEALEEVKKDLKALNADVQVEQWEYDEVVAIKPMFLLAEYE